MSTVDQFSFLPGAPVAFAPTSVVRSTPATVERPREQVRLEGISWQTYEQLLHEIGEGATRLTYNRGVLEIAMSPSRRHETTGWFFGGLIRLLCQLQNIQVVAGGATTHRRQDLSKGIEPDACFWIQHEAVMRGVLELDLAVNPPPDIVVEVDFHSSSRNRIEIYHALGVPEVWWYAHGTLQFLARTDAPDYQVVSHSLCFPKLASVRVQQAFLQSSDIGETEAINRLLTDIGVR